MLTVLDALTAVVRFLAGLTAFLADRRRMQAGEDRAAARSLKEQMTRVQTARAARRGIRPGSLPDAGDPDLRD